MKNSLFKINNPSGQIGTIIFFIFLIFFCILIGRFAAVKSPILVLGLAGGLIIALVTLVNTELTLIILIFSMLLSPEIPIAQIIERAVVVRVDDILLIFIFFAWLAKMAINKELGLFRKTAINIPILLYAFILIISTLKGIIINTVTPVTAAFFLLKYLEYIMLFALVVNNIKSLKQIKKFIFFLLIVYVIVSLNSIRQTIASSGFTRAVSAPFDSSRVHAEPNTLAGYLLFLMGINVGLFLYSDSFKKRLFLMIIFFLAIMPFLFTLSRSAWLGFIFMCLLLVFLSKRMKVTLLILLLMSMVFLPYILPEQVIGRIAFTFQPGVERQILGGRLMIDTSSASRIDAWAYLMREIFPIYPILGKGVTGVGLVDSQYFRVLGEAGILGFVAFIWLMISIFIVAFKNFKNIDNDWAKGLSLGFLVGFTGLLVQAFAANVFIIVRIMEPFMFMTAVMIALGDVTVQTEPLVDT